RTHSGVEGCCEDSVLRLDGPGKIVNIFSVEGDRLGAIRIVGRRYFYAARSNDLVLRHCQADVVSSEIGKKLCGRVELVTIPGALPPDTDFGKSLLPNH